MTPAEITAMADSQARRERIVDLRNPNTHISENLRNELADALERISALESFFEPYHKTAWETHQENTKLREERASFYIDYRMKCDEETKALHVETEKLREEVEKLRTSNTLAAG